MALLAMGCTDVSGVAGITSSPSRPKRSFSEKNGSSARALACASDRARKIERLAFLLERLDKSQTGQGRCAGFGSRSYARRKN